MNCDIPENEFSRHVLTCYLVSIFAIIIPGILLLISYALILKNLKFDLTSPLTGLLDFGYPLGQLTYTAIALVTYSVSRKMLGGLMRRPIIILIAAFFIQFVADYSFIYFKDSFYPACFIDFFYLTAYFIMTLGMITLRETALELKK